MAVRSFALPAAQSRHFCVDTALSIAWWAWCALLALPCVLFLAVVWALMDSEISTSAADEHLSRVWFVIVMAYMAIGVPAAFFWRSRMFRGYWAGDIVSPKDYLIGMLTIWVALEIGGVLGLLGCIVSGTLLPNLLPALLAFMLFTPLWPNGHSMTRPLHNERDPADYEDPR